MEYEIKEIQNLKSYEKKEDQIIFHDDIHLLIKSTQLICYV